MGAKQAFLAQEQAPLTAVSDWARLLIGCRRDQYAASLVARAVEDCDAHLLNLNVTTAGALTGDGPAVTDCYPDFPVQVELRVNHRNTERIGRSLERYGFTVLEAQSSADGTDSDRTMRNFSHLMRYLEI